MQALDTAKRDSTRVCNDVGNVHDKDPVGKGSGRNKERYLLKGCEVLGKRLRSPS